MIMQPMLPVGDLNVAIWTVSAAAVVVDAAVLVDAEVLVGVVDAPVETCVLEVEVVLAGAELAVVVTITVVVPPPQPATSSTTIAPTHAPTSPLKMECSLTDP